MDRSDIDGAPRWFDASKRAAEEKFVRRGAHRSTVCTSQPATRYGPVARCDEFIDINAPIRKRREDEVMNLAHSVWPNGHAVVGHGLVIEAHNLIEIVGVDSSEQSVDDGSCCVHIAVSVTHEAIVARATDAVSLTRGVGTLAV